MVLDCLLVHMFGLSALFAVPLDLKNKSGNTIYIFLLFPLRKDIIRSLISSQCPVLFARWMCTMLYTVDFDYNNEENTCEYAVIGK